MLYSKNVMLRWGISSEIMNIIKMHNWYKCTCIKILDALTVWWMASFNVLFYPDLVKHHVNISHVFFSNKGYTSHIHINSWLVYGFYILVREKKSRFAITLTAFLIFLYSLHENFLAVCTRLYKSEIHLALALYPSIINKSTLNGNINTDYKKFILK